MEFYNSTLELELQLELITALQLQLETPTNLLFSTAKTPRLSTLASLGVFTPLSSISLSKWLSPQKYPANEFGPVHYLTVTAKPAPQMISPRSRVERSTEPPTQPLAFLCAELMIRSVLPFSRT